MSFVKRHLIGVVLLALGLGAIGVGIVYMLGKQTESEEKNAQVMMATSRLFAVTIGSFEMDSGLAPVPPTAENLEMMADNTKKALDFVAKAREAVTAEPLPRLTPTEFALHLPRTLNELKVAAAAARITYPPNDFDFSFSDHRGETQPIFYIVPMLVEQLHDIKAVSTLLIQTQVAAFEKIERISVSQKETKGAPMYLADLMAYTNSVAVVTPYRFTFRCLSGALSKVLVGLGSAPGFWVVKTVEVEPWDPNAPISGGFLPPGILPPGVVRGGVNPLAFPGIPGVGVPGVAMPRPLMIDPNTGLQIPTLPLMTNRTDIARTVLDEKLLRVVLVVEISRPRSEQPKGEVPVPTKKTASARAPD